MQCIKLEMHNSFQLLIERNKLYFMLRVRISITDANLENL